MSTTFNFGANKWAAKEGSVLAYNSENNNFKPLPFTFTRASTATRVNESGLIESVASGVPRIDFLDNADGHLLLEPSRTNLALYSEDLSNAAWSKSLCTITANQIISPSGHLDADLVTTSGTTDTLQQSISATSGTTYTFSGFIKSGSANEIFLVAFGSIPTSVATYNLTNGTATSGTGSPVISIQDYGNGWYRATLTATATSTGTANFYFASGSSNAVSTYYAWGAQLEAGSYATSYIPTSGAAVTRAADNALQTPVSGIIGQTQGSFFVEFEDLNYSHTSIARVLGFSDGTSTNRIYLAQLSSGAMYLVSTGGAEIQEATPSGRRGVLKVAVSYSNNNYKLYVNGVLAGTDTSATVPTCNRFYLGGENAIDASVYKPYKQVKLYNTALSDSELIALTS